MKPSNFRAPRTLSEGTFSVGYSSIRSHRKTSTVNRILLGMVLGLAMIVLALLAGGV